MIEPSLPVNYPSYIYIPIYSFDGVNFKALDVTTDVHLAKSRLRSVLPPAWELTHEDLQDRFKDLKCGLLTFQIGSKSANFYTEFPISEFLKG